MPMFIAGLHEGKNIRKIEGSKPLDKDEVSLFNLIAFKDTIIVSREYFLENKQLIDSWARNPPTGEREIKWRNKK